MSGGIFGVKTFLRSHENLIAGHSDDFHGLCIAAAGWNRLKGLNSNGNIYRCYLYRHERRHQLQDDLMIIIISVLAQ